MFINRPDIFTDMSMFTDKYGIFKDRSYIFTHRSDMLTARSDMFTHMAMTFFCLLLNVQLVWFMVFNTTFNNISAISWQSVLLVEETLYIVWLVSIATSHIVILIFNDLIVLNAIFNNISVISWRSVLLTGQWFSAYQTCV
jgi:hypothetical protein